LAPADLTNGLFEAFGALSLTANVRAIRRDRSVRGVDWRVTSFFLLWGVWNLYYYPSLVQWWSFTGGLFVVVVNAIWLGYAWRYRDRGTSGMHPHPHLPPC
jgi:hypothetical protein